MIPRRVHCTSCIWTQTKASNYKYSNASAQYGLGYCDARRPHDLKFINGEANAEDWKPSQTEINIWEASTPTVPHTHRMRAPPKDRLVARALIAATTVLIVSWIYVTRIVVTLSRTVLATRISSVQGLSSRLIPQSLSL